MCRVDHKLIITCVQICLAHILFCTALWCCRHGSMGLHKESKIVVKPLRLDLFPVCDIDERIRHVNRHNISLARALSNQADNATIGAMMGQH